MNIEEAFSKMKLSAVSGLPITLGVQGTVVNWIYNFVEEPFAYVDGVILAISGKFVDTTRDRTQLGLRKVNKWEFNRGLGVTPEKVEVALFTRRCKPPLLLPQKLHGPELKLKIEEHFL